MATRHRNLDTVLVDLGDLAGARTHPRARPRDSAQATLRPNHPAMATFREQRPGAYEP